MKFIFEDPELEQGMSQPQQMMPQQQEQQNKFIFEDPEESYFNPEMPKEESWGQYFTRLPVAAASTAAKSVGKTYDFLTNLEEGVSSRLLPEDQRQQFREERSKMPNALLSEASIEKGLSKIFPKKYREPKDTLAEKGLHLVAGELPWVALALATGGGAAAGSQALKMATYRAGGSLAGSEGAKAAGLNEFWQGVGGLVGSFGPEILKTTTHQFAKGLQPQLYKKGEELAKGIIENEGTLSKDLLKLDKVVSGPHSGLKGTASIDVQKQIDNITSQIYNGQIPLQDVVDSRRHLNDISKATNNTKEIGYYAEMKSLLDKVIDKAKGRHTEWGKTYDEAQNLTKVIGGIEKAESTFEKAAQGLVGIFPPLKAIKPATWLVNGFIPTEFTPYLMSSPKTATKYLGKIVQSSLVGDVATLRRNLINMDKFISHEDRKMKRKKR